MNYGIEFEFFVVKDGIGKIVPAFEATSNLDGNPITGELRTTVFDNILECVFDLKRRIYQEEQRLADKGYKMLVIPQIKVDNEFIIAVRKNAASYKEIRPLTEVSIYPNGKIGKILPRGVFKASLQVNLSYNKEFSYKVNELGTLPSSFTTATKYKEYSALFNYITPIAKLDKAFAKDIKEAKRVPGVYCFKDGQKGTRIEYRSLPNNINLDLLISTLK